MNIFLRNSWKTILLAISIFIVIILIPPILGNNYISEFFNLKDAGTIGDALGGLTPPFINGLAAILVFIAFNEQVKANNLFKKQENVKLVFEQFKEIKSSHHENINKLKEWNNEDTFFTFTEFNNETTDFFNLSLLVASDMILLCKLVDGLDDDFYLFKSKVYYFYLTEISDTFNKLKSNIESGLTDPGADYNNPIVKNVHNHILKLENKILGDYKNFVFK